VNSVNLEKLGDAVSSVQAYTVMVNMMYVYCPGPTSGNCTSCLLAGECVKAKKHQETSNG